MHRYGVIFCLIFVFCLVQCGSKKEEEVVEGANSPPEIQNVTLIPLNPTVQSEITARILSTDKDGDPITYTVKWFVNGEQIGEGMSFTYPEVKKGDRIFAEVTPHDGKTYGKSMKSGEILIGGLPPRIVSVSIIPEMVYTNTPQVTLEALYEDPDADTIRLIVHWLTKDEVLPDTSSTLQVARLGLKKNDIITGSAFADDGEFRSEPFTFEIPIVNAPPMFTTQTDSVKCSPDSVLYKLPIYDPDGDQLVWEILDAPDGISIDQEQGIIYGSAGETEVFEVQIRVTDSEGAYLDAHFTLTAK